MTDKEYNNLRKKLWRKEHPEEARQKGTEAARKYRENHREQYNAYQLAYYHKNKDRMRARRTAYQREYYRRKREEANSTTADTTNGINTRDSV